ncbi:SDR family oxidoreductase [Bacillus sp. 2205SS5-2]|uniref:SDR family oxidoreductase n=1 Tax=Bacillus sp. 2205SS5-2 TaxID=3109031 RepID=UPI00300651DA
MTNKTYLFTGFPGFLSTQIIKELLKQNKKVHILVLTMPGLKEQAEKSKQEIVEYTGIKTNQFTILEGDITEENCGLTFQNQEKIVKEVSFVWHLAAIYDLAVPKNLAYKVNVEGTKHVNKLVQAIDNLERYMYFSTAYVAGVRKGKLLETELVKPDSFHNYYEETKYYAEIEVEKGKQAVPTTIIRPGIVKGHSRTGETTKFDGPYFIMNMFDKLRYLPFFPHIGDGAAYVNVVPYDYVVQASIHFCRKTQSVGKTYHLTDPNPYTVKEVYQGILQAMLQKTTRGTIPLWMVKKSLNLKPIRKYLGVEAQALDYFVWSGEFNCCEAQKDLAGSEITCPDFIKGVPKMVSFYEENKKNQFFHVVK